MREIMAVLAGLVLACGLNALTISDVRTNLEQTCGRLRTFQADAEWLEIQPGSC